MIQILPLESLLCSSDYFYKYILLLGTVVSQWLSCCAINRKVVGSIQDGVIEIFH